MKHKTTISRRLGQAAVIAVATVFCLEATLYFLKVNPNVNISYEPWPMETNTSLGYRLKPNQRFEAKKTLNREITVYDVINSSDEFGRRETPGQNHKQTDRFILFFGCSYTYGEGVGDNQTLPFYVSQTVPGYRIYNYGIGGYGPAQMLAKLQDAQLRNEIREQGEGVLIYTFIGHHIQRTVGSIDIMNWGREFPYYTIDGSDRLVRRGSFITGRRLQSQLYLLLWKSEIVQFLHQRLKLSAPSDEDIRLTARIIEESRSTFRERFHSDNFFVLLYPHHPETKLISHLERAGIHYFDFSYVPDEAARASIPNDSHPSPRSYQAVASLLIKELEKNRAL